jgi:antitoxin HicB
MKRILKIPLVLTPQPEGGYTVTSPVLPEMVTEGDTLEQVMENVQDALKATLELYQDMKMPLPANLLQDSEHNSISG